MPCSVAFPIWQPGLTTLDHFSSWGKKTLPVSFPSHAALCYCLLMNSYLQVWGKFRLIYSILTRQFSACQFCNAVRAAAYFGEKCWETRYDSPTMDIAYTQTTLTDIRQKFLHVISTDNCSVGRSGNCRLVTTVYSEFINLHSKSKFTRVGMSESSNWSLAKPNAKLNLASWIGWDEIKWQQWVQCQTQQRYPFVLNITLLM